MLFTQDSTRLVFALSVIPRAFAATVFAGILAECRPAFSVGLPFNLFATRWVLAKAIRQPHVLVFAFLRAAPRTNCVAAWCHVKRLPAFFVCAGYGEAVWFSHAFTMKALSNWQRPTPA